MMIVIMWRPPYSLIIKAAGKDTLILKLGGNYFAETSIVCERQIYRFHRK